MKMSTLIAAAALATLAQTAAAAPDSNEREGAVMLYFTKSFGSPRHEAAPLAFGLRLAQVSTVDAMPRVSMLDARLSLSGRTTLDAMGLSMFDSSLQDRRWFSSFASSGGIPDWGQWAIGAALVGGGMCLAEWIFCEDSGSEGPGPDYTPGQG